MKLTLTDTQEAILSLLASVSNHELTGAQIEAALSLHNRGNVWFGLGALTGHKLLSMPDGYDPTTDAREQRWRLR
jgi:hypothetical protein